MKKKLTLLSIILLAFAAVTFTALAQKGKENKGKGNKEQGSNGKGKDDKEKDKGNQGNGGKDHNNGKGNDNKNNNGNGDNDKNDNGNKDHNNAKGKMKDGFAWDMETFKDRKSIRNNMNKVTICHKPGKNGDPGVTIRVSENALKAHMNHGDVSGDCPPVSGKVFSDVFIKRRADYYTVLQNSQEQVLYSRSILDYAFERLTGARTQLVSLQSTNAPAADIERKRLLVVDLEQNATLLQTLIGVTANIVADKLMN
jgi:Ni/Co efflux regulator RcnB